MKTTQNCVQIEENEIRVSRVSSLRKREKRDEDKTCEFLLIE